VSRLIARLLIGFSILAVLLVVVQVVLTLSRPAPVPAPVPPLPKPNGYDDFVQAGRMLAKDTSGFVSLSDEELRALVEKNADALKLARTGLTRACQVPLDDSPTNRARIEDISCIKRLSQALAAQGRLAERENRPADATEAYLSIIQLGRAISQGGVLLDLMVSSAVEAIGTSGLEQVVPALDARQCREAAAAIESSESRREPLEAVLAREREWAYRSYGLRKRIYQVLLSRQAKQIEQKSAARVQTQQVRLRGLLVRLAARAYELEKGRPATSFADLVPVYLKAIPQDPQTGTNLSYRP